ncbi:MAG TPA: hypothetical protein VIE65_22475 [Methylobacter sp.]
MSEKREYPPGYFKGWHPADVVKVLGLRTVKDPQEIEEHCGSVMREFPILVDDYRSGKKNLLGFFINKVMERTRNGADPNITKEILEHLLGGELGRP